MRMIHPQTRKPKLTQEAKQMDQKYTRSQFEEKKKEMEQKNISGRTERERGKRGTGKGKRGGYIIAQTTRAYACT